MITLIKNLLDKGVLGMNYRNLVYIQGLNSRKHYPNADSKYTTKLLAQNHSIPVPELYSLIESLYQVKTIRQVIADKQKIVIKPEHGSGGEGVLIVSSDSEGVLSSGGEKITFDQIQMHCSNIISGLYSLGGQPDRVVLEYFVNADSAFQDITYRGVPDVRIIVCKGIPVMAMLRLPTKASRGRANLHQGAIGAGVDMKSGMIMSGYYMDEKVSDHPDTGNQFEGLQIPQWDKILEIAAHAHSVFKLGYMGVDVVVDQDKGPLLLETNVRPGLAIQLANNLGLNQRLKKILNLEEVFPKIEDRIEFAKSL